MVHGGGSQGFGKDAAVEEGSDGRQRWRRWKEGGGRARYMQRGCREAAEAPQPRHDVGRVRCLKLYFDGVW